MGDLDKVLAEIMRRVRKGVVDKQLYGDAVDVFNYLGHDKTDEMAREMFKIISHLTPESEEEMQLLMDTKKRLLLFEAPYRFDAYLRYIEWDRDIDKQFYPARKRALQPIIKSLQDLADDKLDLLAISLPPGVGKTATAIFYIMWLSGRNPEKAIIGASHSAAFMRGVYDECLRIIDVNGEYLWRDVFPNVPLVSTNAQNLQIDLGNPKRFTTLEFTSIGAGNAGKIRAENLLYCDDLVDGIETALNIERLNKLWEQYKTDLRQRKIANCKELHIATRWSVHDPIGRLQLQYEDSDRARFIAVPALNENDQSNFDYVGVPGFSTGFYHEQRDMLDEISWKALYMNEPIEREGLLYEESELRRFFDLPEGEPDGIFAVCDTKDKGNDYCVMPVAYKYGENYYIADCVCDNRLPEYIDPKLVAMLYAHKVKLCQFESNSAGGRTAEKIRKDLKAKGGNTTITTKYTTANKETKIIINSPFIKEHFLFRDKSTYENKSDYSEMIKMLCTYTVKGKNKHDDVPDALAMLAEYVQTDNYNTITVVKRPF